MSSARILTKSYPKMQEQAGSHTEKNDYHCDGKMLNTMVMTILMYK